MFIGILVIIIGLLSIIQNNRNYIGILLCIELITVSLSYISILISLSNDDLLGISFPIILLAIAAAEAALTLSLIIKVI